MSEQELQELSRQAAACLGEVCATGSFDRGGRRLQLFLHEDTERCTEIMVRVLWANNVVIGGSVYPANVVIWGTPIPMFVTKEQIPDPLLAFRVAVLRALISLKTES